MLLQPQLMTTVKHSMTHKSCSCQTTVVLCLFEPDHPPKTEVCILPATISAQRPFSRLSVGPLAGRAYVQLPPLVYAACQISSARHFPQELCLSRTSVESVSATDRLSCECYDLPLIAPRDSTRPVLQYRNLLTGAADHVRVRMGKLRY